MHPLLLRPLSALRGLAGLALDHPTGCIAIVGVLTLFMAVGLVRLEVRTDGVVLHPEGSATI